MADILFGAVGGGCSAYALHQGDIVGGATLAGLTIFCLIAVNVIMKR